MKKKSSNPCILLFTLLAAVLAIVILMICLTQKNAAPRLISRPEDAEKCMDALFSSVNQCDYAAVSALLYGQPQLEISADYSSGAGPLLHAFCSSVQYTPEGEWHPTDVGISRAVRFDSLKLTDMIDLYREDAPKKLAAAVSESDPEIVFNEDGELQAEFLRYILHTAASDAVFLSDIAEQSLTVNLVFDKGQWWVIPDEALLDAISGGILH